MHYNEINWDNVSSATPTAEGLVLTYHTPQVGIGQTQVIPLEISGTAEQAAEFNERFGVGQTMARYGGPFQSSGARSVDVTMHRSSPPGSYGQVPGAGSRSLSEEHNVHIQTFAQPTPANVPGVIFHGSYFGPVVISGQPAFTSQFWNFICDKVGAWHGHAIWFWVDGKLMFNGQKVTCFVS